MIQILIGLFKFTQHLLLPVKCLDDCLTGEYLLDLSVDLTQILLLSAEELLAELDDADDERHGDRQDDQRDQRHERRDRQHHI